MAGHNTWSKVKRPKGALDAKRGKLLSRFLNGMMAVARLGNGNTAFSPDETPRFQPPVPMTGLQLN